MPGQVNPIPQTSSVPTPSQGINWKYVLIGIIVGAVLIGGSGYVVYNAYQPKKEETKKSMEIDKNTTKPLTTKQSNDWKTYENRASSIRIKYPPNLEYAEETKVKGNLATAVLIPPGNNVSFVTFKFSADGKESLAVISSINYAEGKAVEFAKLYSETLSSNSATELETSEIQVGGVTAYKLEFPENDMLITWYIYIDSLDKKSGYTIATVFNKANQETVEQMISSLEFLK